MKRKRNEIEDAEDGEVQMRSKRSETNANYIREIAQSKANNTPPPRWILPPPALGHHANIRSGSQNSTPPFPLLHTAA